MNQWAGKDIKLLSDDELWAAIQAVADIYNYRFDKLKDPRINKPKHRLNKIFKANPPEENKTFTDLCDNLNNEWRNRNSNKGKPNATV
jgi:hypothetical protein